MRLVVLFGCVAAVLAGFSPDARAYDSHAYRYGISNEPLYKVGTRSSPLSLLCRQGQFNEVRINFYYMTFTNPQWGGTVGIAKVGFNLYDPGNKGNPNESYFFYEDGTSDCAVYLAHDH